MEDQCHQLLQCVILVDSVHPCEQVIESIRDLLHEMTKIKEGRCRSVRRGRPRVGICEQQLEFLVENNFRTKDIALIFGCSPRTIERRKAELHIAGQSYSSISDTDLDSLVEEFTYLHPHCGEKMLSGWLQSRGAFTKTEGTRFSSSYRSEWLTGTYQTGAT